MTDNIWGFDPQIISSAAYSETGFRLPDGANNGTFTPHYTLNYATYLVISDSVISGLFTSVKHLPKNGDVHKPSRPRARHTALLTERPNKEDSFWGYDPDLSCLQSPHCLI